MIKPGKEAVSASLESLIRDKYQTYRLSAFPNKKTSRLQMGSHSSIFKGRGMDFEEVREYQPGDDVRLVDWRITAKQGRTFTKIFKEEREHQVWFLIDLRHSMHFGTRQAFKSVIAAHIAAMLTWFFVDKGDKIGGIVLSDKQMNVYRPSKLHRSIIQFLYGISQKTQRTSDYLKPIEEEISLSTACMKLRRTCRNGNIIFVISDFSDFSDDMFKCLASLSRTNDLVLINIYDELEGRCPVPNVYPVTNGDETIKLDTTVLSHQKAYENYFKRRHDTLQNFSENYPAIKYVSLSTKDDFLTKVANSLRRRSS